MSALSLADIERERNKLSSRQASNEKSWNEFLESPEVPPPKRENTTLEQWTARMRDMYEGTKDAIIVALERLREKEAILRLREQSAIVSSPSRHTGAEPLTAAPPSQILLTKLNNPEYGMAEDSEIIKKDLIKFYIYYFTIQKYSEEVATQLCRTKTILDDNWFIKNKDYKKPLEDLVRGFCYKQLGNINPDVDTINVIYNLHTNPPPPFSLPTRSSSGGHKSARRVKSKCRSRSKCRSKSKSKKHRCRG